MSRWLLRAACIARHARMAAGSQIFVQPWVNPVNWLLCRVPGQAKAEYKGDKIRRTPSGSASARTPDSPVRQAAQALSVSSQHFSSQVHTIWAIDHSAHEQYGVVYPQAVSRGCHLTDPHRPSTPPFPSADSSARGSN
jgi:hypothetical protein